jgi:hypothetical protein
MACRVRGAQLAELRRRVAKGEPVKQTGDSPQRWERAETCRAVRAASRATDAFLKLEAELEVNADAEVNTRKLALIVGEDETKPDLVTEVFGPRHPGTQYGNGELVYYWREVRRRAHHLMVSRVIQRLARSLAAEYGGVRT